MARIYVNETGYLPAFPKFAALKGDCESFSVIDGEGREVFSAPVQPPVYDAPSGDNVRRADFSAFTHSGVYRIKAGDDTSPEFTIGDGVYRELTGALLKCLYYQRCGCSLSEKYAGPYARGVCHRADAALLENDAVRLEANGGWHDAGDFGRYVTPGAVAVSHLLLAYELYPDAFQAPTGIPESGNGIPDVLNECLVELRWLRKMMAPDGGAYHKLTTRVHAPFEMPEEDHEPLIVFPVSSMATGALAGCLAQAARIYREFIPDEAERMKQAALAAYGWLKRHPEMVGFTNPEGCNTGEYGDRTDADERYWAAAELFRLTGEEGYLDDCRELLGADFDLLAFGWDDNGGFGTAALLLDHAADEALRAQLTDCLTSRCADLLQTVCASPYGLSLKENEFVWGSNLLVGTRGMQLAIAARLTGERTYLDAAAEQLNYLLGRNALGVSFVTGFGEHAFRHPHQRITECDGVDEPMPGWVSGGPNGHPADEEAIRMLPESTPPAKCWVDHAPCYSLNEVAIYWNTPFAFLSAAVQT